ncbi:hypothetical protein Hdeb2414_s0115g00800321 [Helianthus debilis subsp. tardiflorus]
MEKTRVCFFVTQHTHTYIYNYIYIYKCVCVCVCASYRTIWLNVRSVRDSTSTCENWFITCDFGILSYNYSPNFLRTFLHNN